jgi:hypothetical protein
MKFGNARELSKLLLWINFRRLYQKFTLVVEQFDKLTVTPVETTSAYQTIIRFDKLGVQFFRTNEMAFPLTKSNQIQGWHP